MRLRRCAAAMAVVGIITATGWSAETPAPDALARQAASEHRFAAARELYIALSKAHPDNAEYWTWIGRLSGYLRDYEASISAFNAALRLAPQDVDSLVGKANVLLWRHDYSAATPILELAEELAPESADVALANARWYFYQDQTGEARRYIERAIIRDPDNPEALAFKERLRPHRSVRVEFGVISDRFSYRHAGMGRFVDAGLGSASDSISVHLEEWSRFDRSVIRGGLNFSHAFNSHWTLEASALLGSRGDALARHDESIVLKRRLRSGWAASAAYRDLTFDQTHVRMIGPGIEYSFERPISIELSYLRSWTQWPGVQPERKSDGSVLVRYMQRVGPAGLHLGWSRGNEPLILPRIDSWQPLISNTYLAGADLPLSAVVTARLQYAVQHASSGTLEQTVSVSLVARK